MERGLRELKREATGEALAHAAFELARERGLDGFVIDDVVQRAGYSRRTFANYFSCKEEAVASVGFARVEDAGALLADLPADLPLVDALQAVLRQQFAADTLVTMRELMAMVRRYPTLEPYLLSVQNRMRHAAQDLVLSVAGDRYPGIYVPLLFGAVYGAVTAALEGLLDVQLADEDADAAGRGAMEYGSFVDVTFEYLRTGF